MEGFIQKLKLTKRSRVKGNIIKSSIFELDPKMISGGSEWLWMNTTENEHFELKETLQNIIPHKLLNDFTHSVLYNQNLGIYLILNRALVDPKMEFFYKVNQRERDRGSNSEADQSREFQMLENDEELKIENFTGIQNGMKIR